MPIVLILLLFGTIAGGGWFYYTDTQNTIAQLRENNAQLKVAVETNEKTIETMAQQAEISAELSQELAQKLQVSEASRNRLIEVFGKHDLTRLALKKPGLIETRINNGTKKAFDGIESVSGAPIDDGVQSTQ
jgi:hypothetical protein